MNKIENIIFDFGGVLYDIDFDRSTKAFEHLGFKVPEMTEDISRLFNMLEIGSISPAEFVSQIQLMSEKHIPDKDIINAFNLILVGINPNKVADLRKLHELYDLYLLSNTNSIHYELYSKEIKNNKATEDFYNLFKNEFYSHKLGMRKPDLSIFYHVLNEAHLNPFGTLFVDDSYDNILAASSLGIQTFWIENADSWEKLMLLLI
jgi:glucose-1-phosphatase